MADRYDELDDQERTFCDRYVLTLDAHRAALDAKYALTTARTHAYTWVKDPGAKPALYETIQHRRKEHLKNFEVEASELRQRVWLAATADPTELVEFRRTCCRWCWGALHKYQWTLNELQAAVANAERMGGKLPDLEGGVGFDATRDPAADCPECFGEGIETIRAKDSRDLSVGARMIFKGVKRTKGGGFEVVTADQLAYKKFFAELCGMTIKKIEATGKDGSPLFAMPEKIVLIAQGEDEEPEPEDDGE